MASSNKTKAEILLELESLQGLLLEDDDIPILQTVDPGHSAIQGSANQGPATQPPTVQAPAPEHSAPDSNPVLAAQTSLFAEEPLAAHTEHVTEPALPNSSNATRPLAKASGENPFLPQHIRDRLHGNNPPPLFEYETAKKILNASKQVANKINKPRQQLIDDVITGLLPQIEAELRHRLFAMSLEDLEKLLQDD